MLGRIELVRTPGRSGTQTDRAYQCAGGGYHDATLAGNLALMPSTPTFDPSVDLVERRALVCGDVIRFIAPDLVLRFVLAGAVRVSLVIEILCVNLDDPAAHLPGLRIPAHVIADFESFAHDGAPA